MAAKVNTKFVAILSLTLFTGVASVGGVLWWVLKNDATRLIRKGDEAAAAGDWSKVAKSSPIGFPSSCSIMNRTCSMETSEPFS